MIEESQRAPFYAEGSLNQECVDAIDLYYIDSKKAGFIDMSIGERFIVTSFRG